MKVTTVDGGKKATGRVTVQSSTINVIDISISTETMTLNVGNTGQLTATISPSNATNKNVVWITDDSEIATVSSTGLVTGVSAGSTIVRVITVEGRKTGICSVTVENLSGKLPEIVVPQLVPVVDDGNYDIASFAEPEITGFVGTNVYFVSPIGDDSNSGISRTVPLKTLLGAISKIELLYNPTKATILFEDGEYPITSKVNLLGKKFAKTCHVDIRGIGNNAVFTGAEKLNNSNFVPISMNGTTVYQYDLSGYNLNYTYGNTTSEWGDTISNFLQMPFIIMNGKKGYIASYPHKYKVVDLGKNGAATSSEFTFTLPSNTKTTINTFKNISSEVFLY